MIPHPTALLSYSHDSPEHEASVLELCNRLRARGVDATCDQFLAGAPSEGWPLWMERQIESRDFTLIVCTEAYRRRFMEDEASGVGRGVVWEARILRNLLYQDSERHGRIVPVLLETTAREFVPTVFRGNFYDLSAERGFENLLRHLLREPGAEAAALGPLGPQGSRWSAFERPWLVPDALRTRYFTGREALLASLRTQLLERGRAALSGLGGIGKTQVALEYARRNRETYPDGVFWVNAETTSGLTSGFVEIAKALNLAVAGSSDQEQVVQAVVVWLNGTNGWLLILDNVEERSDVSAFLPQRGKGHVLITSREPVFQEIGIARGLGVVDLDANEALLFLLSRTGREQCDAQERAAAAKLAEELGHLPLALEQAAAYIAENSSAFADYLDAFRKRRVTLLERSRELVTHDTVAVTWATNFDAVMRASPAAADVLRLSSFLAPDAIPFELFTQGASALGDPVSGALADPEDALAMGELLRPLARYSLIRVDAASRTLSVHRLVQEIVRAAVGEPGRRAYVERIVGALNAAFPDVEYKNWTQCDRLVQHVVAISPSVAEYDLQSDAAGRVLNETGCYLSERGRYAESEALLKRSVAIRERSLGDHPDTAGSLNNLGCLYQSEGRHAEAEPLHERALAMYEKTLGPDHRDVAIALNNLAIDCLELGRNDEAESLHERALLIRQSVLGSDHPEVAASLINIANVHLKNGRYAEAQPMYERALAINEAALGPNHPDVATNLNNLASLRWRQGAYAEAQALHERALAIRERALGPDHPTVAFSVDGLAGALWKQGRYADARALYERAVAIWERAFGPDYPELAYSLTYLAHVNREQGRFVDAEELYARGLAIRERALGSDHPEVAQSLAGLALLYKDQGRIADAIPLFERALAIKERTLRADHPELAEIRANLDTLRNATRTNDTE